jgi:hypothetical protein
MPVTVLATGCVWGIWACAHHAHVRAHIVLLLPNLTAQA